MPNYNNILKFFDEYISHYRELLSFENEKLNLIATDNISELSTGLSKEQALIMKGSSFETKRMRLMKDEGLSDVKFQAIIDGAPAEYSAKLHTAFNELSKYVTEVKRINDHSLSIVRGKLSAIEARISSTSSDIYDEKGGRKHSIGSLAAVNKNI